jgi:hypothetical protein
LELAEISRSCSGVSWDAPGMLRSITKVVIVVLFFRSVVL